MIGPELRLRILSAIVLAVVVLVLTWLGGIWFRFLAVVIAGLIHYEFSKMTDGPDSDPAGRAIAWAAVALALALVLAGYPLQAILAVAAGTIGAAVPALATGRKPWAATGVAYAGLSGIALAELRGESLFGLFAMLFVFAVVWATDIMAYFCGRAIGGRKLAPKISPGKTVSGAVFGAAAGVAAGLAVALALRPGGGLALPLIALVLSVSAQAGDLFESWIKRRFAVKDSSHLIPGHGGVMDRVDGLVFAAFAAFVLAAILPPSHLFRGGDELAARLLGQ